jgi:hypothetical protein
MLLIAAGATKYRFSFSVHSQKFPLAKHGIDLCFCWYSAIDTFHGSVESNPTNISTLVVVACRTHKNPKAIITNTFKHPTFEFVTDLKRCFDHNS